MRLYSTCTYMYDCVYVHLLEAARQHVCMSVVCKYIVHVHVNRCCTMAVHLHHYTVVGLASTSLQLFANTVHVNRAFTKYTMNSVGVHVYVHVCTQYTACACTHVHVHNACAATLLLEVHRSLCLRDAGIPAVLVIHVVAGAHAVSIYYGYIFCC